MTTQWPRAEVQRSNTPRYHSTPNIVKQCSVFPAIYQACQ